jgi:hypothetical protein
VTQKTIPNDPRLPQMSWMLDPEAMARVLARSLRPGAIVDAVRIVYLRYKPGTRLIVRYGVSVDRGWHDASVLAEPQADLPGWARDPVNVALAKKANGRSPAQTPLAYDHDLRALVQWFPVDISMPALAETPAALRARLRDAGVDVRGGENATDLLAYKARRRAVLRLDGHVVKIYAGSGDFDNAVLGLDASGRLSELVVPTSEAVLREFRLTCQTLLAGKPPQGHHAAARAAGSALAALHEAPPDGLQPVTPERQLAAAASSARSAAAVAPELEDRLERVMREVEATLPDVPEHVAAHGDFHANQVLELDEGLAVIDFDEMCTAPAALDFASYVAHLVTGGRGEFEAAAAALDDLVAGYGERPAGLAWYVATSIIRRAPFPFRFMDEDWPRRIEQMVADAEEALRL